MSADRAATLVNVAPMSAVSIVSGTQLRIGLRELHFYSDRNQ